MQDPVRNTKAKERFHAYDPEKQKLWWDIENRCVRGLAACIHPQVVEANHRSGFNPRDHRAAKLLFPKYMSLRVVRAVGRAEDV